MAFPRGLSRPLTCHSCQRWILRSFIASVGGPTSLQTATRSPRRAFAQQTNVVRSDDGHEEHALNEINGIAATASMEIPPDPKPAPVPDSASAPALKSTDNTLPWYLQVQQPLPQPDLPLSHRQKLPELPLNPPGLLQPLLEHVSVELGMDDLSLLDLRALDPPPALGSNLLMAIGTARSEKHLHVSADRLCRWLRTEYKLSPFADGLLGRNELKLKLRRKMKRARLLSAVGAKDTANTDIDDGIRTGWVCVNVGRVPGGELTGDGASAELPEGVVGFGSIAGGSSIVVQLMTEDKRGEIDLEKLWTDTLHRSQKLKEKAEEQTSQAKEADGDEEVDPTIEPTNGPSALSALQTMVPASSHPHRAIDTSQFRSYHTSARRLASAAQTDISESALDKAQPDACVVELEGHISRIKAMRSRHALEALGIDLLLASAQLGFGESHSQKTAGPEPKINGNLWATPYHTPFLESFYGSMPIFPGPEHCHMHFELLAYARQLGHVDLHASAMITQLKKMQAAGLVPEERTFKLVLRSVLAPLGRAHPYKGEVNPPSESKMNQVLIVLENMELCGYDPFTPEILELLHQACLGPPPPPSHMLEVSSMIPALRVAYLRRRIRCGDWIGFRREWHAYPRHFLPRPAGVYMALFEAIADGKLETAGDAMDAMQTCLPQMGMEDPPIKLDSGLAKALMRALEHLEPGLQKPHDDKSLAANSAWRAWYDQCRHRLRGAQPDILSR